MPEKRIRSAGLLCTDGQHGMSFNKTSGVPTCNSGASQSRGALRILPFTFQKRYRYSTKARIGSMNPSKCNDQSDKM